MNRVVTAPRPDWREKVEHLGLLFHTHEGTPYWFESAYYEFTSAEVERLEAATNTLSEMCLEAVEHVVSRRRYADLRIPPALVPAIEQSWEGDHPSIYGRFDLAFDGHSVKLLEYNADTPTSLLEAAVVQWHWLQEIDPEADQFNSIWEALVDKWAELKQDPGLQDVVFATDPAFEDVMTAAVLRDTAEQAGIATQHISLADVGWNSRLSWFVDRQERPIQTLFKLHPWEQLVADPFGVHAIETYGQTLWIEPAWKLLLSNKALLALLWELYPGHELLLPAFLDGPRDLAAYVEKPIFGREGSNTRLVREGQTLEATAGDYGEEGFVYQALFDLPSFAGMHPVIGSWVVDHAAQGMGIRETKGLITDDFAQFVPHLFR